MQILKAYNKELISEIAIQCDDISFRDFSRDVYAQAAYRAMRSIAKTYGILDYEIAFQVESFDEDWLVLPAVNIRNEVAVIVDDIEYEKVNEFTPEENETTDTLEYIIKFNAKTRTYSS